jgi:uncharacterized membrane protein YuzA (DUF378 family)
MLGRRQKSVTDKVRSAGSDLVDSGSSTAKRVMKRKPGKVDSYVAGALALGMGNWLSMSLFNFDAVKAVAGSKSTSGRATYGALGLAALYATMRGARKASR